MSNGRFRILVSREGADGKKFYTKIGMAFPLKSGQGYSLRFDALPCGDNAVLLPDDDDRQQGGGGGGRGGDTKSGQRRGYPDRDYANDPSSGDDGIPF